MKQSIESLEFNLITEEIISFTLSQEGRDHIRALGPSQDRETVSRELEITGMTAQLLRFREPQHVSSFPEISQSLVQVSKPGTALDAGQLYDIGIYLRYAVALHAWYTFPPEGYQYPMPACSEQMPGELKEVSGRLLRELDAPGIIRKDHPRLKPLYRELEGTRRLRSELSLSYIQKDPSLWQQESPTIRDGRIVLPVKSSHRSKVPGFIHGISATGNTLYVEPQELAESNNQVTIWEQKIQAECLAILRELSSLVRNSLEDIRIAASATGRLDHLLAKARFCVIRQCEVPFVGGQEFRLHQARHPLLGRAAIPIDVEISPGTRAVIITGPNAGGKTVTVKTMGLFALMVQHGIPVPASTESRIPLFSSIHADIGDDQSIAESLSTFSAHMKKIAELLEKTDSDSLVILDELASGTDTLEGAALAKAVTSYCLDRGCLTMVTTHHMSLKQFAYSDSRVINASMEFDDAKKIPTYRVIVGTPGNSYAIETAGRMGIPEKIIELARAFLDDESDKAAKMIRGLEQQELELEQVRRKLDKERQKLEEQRRAVDLKVLQVRQQELIFRKKDVSFIRSFVDSSRSELENLVRSLREGELTREKLKRVKEFQEKLEEQQETQNQYVKQRQKEISGIRGLRFSPGTAVLAGTGKTRGVITRKGKKEGYWHVEMGSLRIDIHENELIPIENESDTFYDAPQTVEIRYDNHGSLPKFELDLRGMTLEQASAELEQQIDRSLLHGVSRFGIIHGKGEGILQRGIHEALSQHPSVKSYYFAHPDQGGFGKTIVEIET